MSDSVKQPSESALKAAEEIVEKLSEFTGVRNDAAWVRDTVKNIINHHAQAERDEVKRVLEKAKKTLDISHCSCTNGCVGVVTALHLESCDVTKHREAIALINQQLEKDGR